MTDRPLIIAIDFDGTLAEFDGWRGEGVYGRPVPGAVRSCWRLAAAGHRLVVWTSRTGEEEAIKRWLRLYGFPEFEAVNEDISGLGKYPKIVADVYLDDRGIWWDGWSGVVDHIFDTICKRPSVMVDHTQKEDE